mgnify:CR=1 FL=1
MIERQRQLIIERDSFLCVRCHGTCGNCNLLPSIEPYFQEEKFRHPLGRLQVNHKDGRSPKGPLACERWDQLETLCPCCHRKGRRASGEGSENLHSVGQEPPEYAGLLVLSQEDWERRMKSNRARRKRARAQQKEWATEHPRRT